MARNGIRLRKPSSQLDLNISEIQGKLLKGQSVHSLFLSRPRLVKRAVSRQLIGFEDKMSYTKDAWLKDALFPGDKMATKCTDLYFKGKVMQQFVDLTR